MPIETGTVIEDLDSLWPLGGDGITQGDDHIRFVKAILKTQFPGVDGLGFKIPITATEAEINNLTGVTGDVQDQLDLKYDKAGGTITGDVIVDVATLDAAAIALRNDEGGLQLSVDGGDASILVTQADGTLGIAGIFIAADGAVTLSHNSIAQLLTSVTGGQLANVWIAPTAAPGTDTTQLATTAFVQDRADSITSSGTSANGNFFGVYDIALGQWLVTQWGSKPYTTRGKTATFTFPISFGATPTVVAGIGQGNTGNTEIWTSGSGISATQFELTWGYDQFRGINWIAQGTL